MCPALPAGTPGQRAAPGDWSLIRWRLLLRAPWFLSGSPLLAVALATRRHR